MHLNLSIVKLTHLKILDYCMNEILPNSSFTQSNLVRVIHLLLLDYEKHVTLNPGQIKIGYETVVIWYFTYVI